MKSMRSLFGSIWLRKDFSCGNLTAGEKFGNFTIDRRLLAVIVCNGRLFCTADSAQLKLRVVYPTEARPIEICS